MTAVAASCHEAVGRQARPGAPTVALVGSPNAGKSTLFNALTGAGRAVGNYPGTTVEVGAGTWSDPAFAGVGGDVAFADMPGAYSLTPMSPDERLAADLAVRIHPRQRGRRLLRLCAPWSFAGARRPRVRPVVFLAAMWGVFTLTPGSRPSFKACSTH